MGRTAGPDEIPSRPKRGPRSTMPRSVLISKALSRLLRHQAVNERIPISSDGWVNIADVLAWKGLSSRNGIDPLPTLDEIFEIVEENEKKRFVVKPVKPSTSTAAQVSSSKSEANEASTHEAEASVQHGSEVVVDESSATIAAYRAHPLPAKEYLIRASQGHSIAVDDTIMVPITLESVPTTCVHGTFYGAWPAILASGGLKRMGRNHVHFAMGPSLDEVQGTGERAEVISGMRRDAQVLVYVDLKRAVEDGMAWFRSENGVLLTEGVEEKKDGEVGEEEEVKQQKKGKMQAREDGKMVGMKYWDVVVDVKGKRGVIWRQGEGVIQELPDELTRGGNPKDRGRGGGRGGRGRGR